MYHPVKPLTFLPVKAESNNSGGHNFRNEKILLSNFLIMKEISGESELFRYFCVPILNHTLCIPKK